MYEHEGLCNGVSSGVYCNINISDTSSTELLAAPVSTYKFHMTDVIVTNSGTVLTSIVFSAASGQTMTVHLAANGGGFSHSFRRPFKFGPGTLNAQLSTTPTSGTVKVVVCGFWLPVPNTN